MAARGTIERMAIDASMRVEPRVGEDTNAEALTLAWIEAHTDGEDWSFRLPPTDAMLVRGNVPLDATTDGEPYDVADTNVGSSGYEAMMKTPPLGVGHTHHKFSWAYQSRATRYGFGKPSRTPICITSPAFPPMFWDVRGTRVRMGTSAAMPYVDVLRILQANRAARAVLRAARRREPVRVTVITNALERARIVDAPTLDIEAVAAALAVSSDGWVTRS